MDSTAHVNIIEQALEEVFERLQELPASARVRVLRARAASYRHVVAFWAHSPPSVGQRAAMLECVMMLHGAVVLDQPMVLF